MVASLVGPLTPTSPPTDTRCAVTTPSNGAVDPRVAEVDRGDRHAGLVVQDLRLVGVALGARLVHLRLRGEVALAQSGLPVELGLGLHQVGLGRRQGRLRLLQLRLIGRRLDDEQRVALLDLGAVLIVDLAAGSPAPAPRGRPDCTATALPVSSRYGSTVLLHRLRHADLRRRRRDVGVLLLTRRGCRQRQAQRHQACRPSRNIVAHPIPPSWPAAVQPISCRGGSVRRLHRRTRPRRPASGTSPRSGSRHRPRRAPPSTPSRRGSARTR